MSGEELQNLTRLEDQNIVINNLSLQTFPSEVEAEMLYLKNIKDLKELTINAKVKTLIISNCHDLEKISFLTAPDNLIIDHCIKLVHMPYRLELKKLIISRCPKLKQIARVLIAEKCILIKSVIDSLAEKMEARELILFNVKLESFATEFKVKKLLFSHLSPLQGEHFKPYFMTSDSIVEKIKILNYEDLLDYYAFAQNYPDTMTLLRLAQGEAEGLINNYLNVNLSRLDELSLVLSNTELRPDPYSRFKAFWREVFKK